MTANLSVVTIISRRIDYLCRCGYTCVMDTVRRRGLWHVEYEVGGSTFIREVDDTGLLTHLADRYGIENRVTYVGPEVEEANCAFAEWSLDGGRRGSRRIVRRGLGWLRRIVCGMSG